MKSKFPRKKLSLEKTKIKLQKRLNKYEHQLTDKERISIMLLGIKKG